MKKTSVPAKRTRIPEPAKKPVKKAVKSPSPAKLRKMEKQRIRRELKQLNKRRKVISHVPDSVQKTLPYVAEYDKGILELGATKKGSNYSMTMEIENINYKILGREQTQNALENYRDFLNTFRFGNFYQLSIVKGMESREAFEEHIEESVKKKAGDSLNQIRREMKKIILDTMTTNVAERKTKLYLTTTISAKNQLEAFKNFDRIEGEHIKNLTDFGSNGRRLDTYERMEMLYDVFRPDRIGKFTKSDLVKSKSVFQMNKSFKDYISPPGFNFYKDHIEAGDYFYQCMYLTNFPSSIEDTLINELAALDMDMIITISHTTYHMPDAIKMINKQLTNIKKDMISEQKKHSNDGIFIDEAASDELQDDYDNAKNLRDSIRHDNQKMSDISILIMHYARTEAELEENKNALVAVADNHSCTLEVLHNLQEPAMCQIIPFGQHELPDLDIPLPAICASIFVPFSAVEFDDSTGCWYGKNLLTKQPIIIDRLNLPNGNGMILGASGFGKSMSAKNETNQVECFAENEEVIIIDPDDEYGEYHRCGKFNSELLVYGAGSDIYQNLMDLSEDFSIDGKSKPLETKIEFLMSVFSLFIKNGKPLEPVETGILDECLQDVYREFINCGYQKDMTPTLVDVYDALNDYSKTHDRVTGAVAATMAKSLAPYAIGSLNYFAHKTNVNVEKKDLIIYNIKNLRGVLKDVGYMVMLENIWNRSMENKKKGIITRIYADEFTVVLSNPYSKEIFWNMYKRFRKVGGLITGITQNITAILDDPQASEMLANAEFLILLKQSEQDIIQLKEILNFSDEQIKYVRNVGIGYGLIKAGNKIVPFEMKYPKDTMIYKVMSTKPREEAS